MILFRSKALIRSWEYISGSADYNGLRCTVLFRSGANPPQKGNLHDFVPLKCTPIVYFQ